jgi:prepilin-type N-terminal cleavage/methylation domain-containing protein
MVFGVDGMRVNELKVENGKWKILTLNSQFSILNSIGYSLIEVLIVIAILGILFAIVLFNINPKKQIDDANATRSISELVQTKKTIEVCVTEETVNGKSKAAIFQVGSGSGGCGDLDFLKSQNYTQIWPYGMTIDLTIDGNGFCLTKLAFDNAYYYVKTRDGRVRPIIPTNCLSGPYSYP